MKLTQKPNNSIKTAHSRSLGRRYRGAPYAGRLAVMTIDLSTSQELQMRLDPVASEDRFPSVASDIEAKFTMPFQQTTISIKECWFSHADLNRFEEELGILCRQETGSAVLLNMSGIPIVAVERCNEKVTTRVQATDTAGMGKVVLEVTGYPSEIPAMLEKVREYPKWW